MKVADILEKKGTKVLTIKPNETIASLAKQLRQHRVGAMVVSQSGDTIDGIISERDIAYALADRRGDLHLLPVSALMTRRVVTCTPDDSLQMVCDVMAARHFRHLPVVAGSRLAGIISLRDVVESRLAAVGRRSTMLRGLAGVVD